MIFFQTALYQLFASISTDFRSRESSHKLGELLQLWLKRNTAIFTYPFAIRNLDEYHQLFISSNCQLICKTTSLTSIDNQKSPGPYREICCILR